MVDVVDGVVVLVVAADVVGTLLLLTLVTMIVTSPRPLMTTPQAGISKFYAIITANLAVSILRAREPIVVADWPEPTWPWPLAAKFGRAQALM